MDILQVAVGATEGVARFSIAKKDRALNHLSQISGNPHTGGERQGLMVVTVTLAVMLEHMPAPHLIKVDVEGGELAVLTGAGRVLLHDVRPKWIIEVAPENALAVGAILRSASYKMFDVSAPQIELAQPAWNTLAVPAEAV